VRTKLALLLAALAFVAGCGGGGSDRMSKAEFEQRIQTDGSAIQKAVTGLSSASSLSELAAKVAPAEKAVKAAADDLEQAKPPADAEGPTKTIVAALQAVEAQLKQLEEAAKKNDVVAVQKIAQAIQSSPKVAAAQQAAKELKKKGYKIGVLGS
jgi:hypothetical protein